MPKAKSLTSLIEAYLSAYADRLSADRAAKALKDKENVAKAAVVALMLKEDQTAVETDMGRVSVKSTSVPKITNRQKFYDWCARTKNMECLQPRVSATQLREVMDASPRLRPGGIEFEPVLKVTPTLRKK
jgi:hypothetical protein